MTKEIKTFDELFDEKFNDKDFCCCGYEYCSPTENKDHVIIIKIKQFFKDYLDKELEQKDLHCHEVINDMVAEHKKEIEDLERECVGERYVFGASAYI